jgi:hypothetical protein
MMGAGEHVVFEHNTLQFAVANGIATIVVARWEKAFDERQATAALNIKR